MTKTLRQTLDRTTLLADLATRFTIGFLFAQSGYGKLTHLDQAIEFFTSIGIPFPSLQAPLVAGLEFTCGVLVLLGLGTRVAALPLIGIMAVALKAAKWNDIAEIGDLLGTSEFLYIVLLLWIVGQGAGLISVDAWLRRRICSTC